MQRNLNISSIIIITAIGVIAGIFFNIFPQTDIAFSKLFFLDGEFIYKNLFFVNFLNESAKYLTTLMISVLLVSLVINFIKKKALLFTNLQIIFLLSSGVIGPGILVHDILKDNWDRARPLQTEEFGGEKKFTPALVITNQCNKNCSFPSGHAAAGFSIAIFALLYKGLKRKIIYTAGIFSGFLYGFGRILEGKHFFSDIIFSGIFVMLTAHLLHYLIFDVKIFEKYKWSKKWLK